MAIGENSTQTKLMTKALENILGNVGIKIITKSFDTKFTDQQVEFLDVLHKHSSELSFKFITYNYVKQAILDRTFINGTSHTSMDISICRDVRSNVHTAHTYKDNIDY